MKRTLAMLVLAAVTSVALAVAAIAVAASSPTVTTGTHSHVTDTSAVLHGTVNPNGSATTYAFQWGSRPRTAASRASRTRPDMGQSRSRSARTQPR